MPPKKRSAAAAEDYDSDNGFVEDVAPKSKRSKVSKEEGSGGGGGGGTKGKDKDGEVFWEVCG